MRIALIYNFYFKNKLWRPYLLFCSQPQLPQLNSLSVKTLPSAQRKPSQMVDVAKTCQSCHGTQKPMLLGDSSKRVFSKIKRWLREFHLNSAWTVPWLDAEPRLVNKLTTSLISNASLTPTQVSVRFLESRKRPSKLWLKLGDPTWTSTPGSIWATSTALTVEPPSLLWLVLPFLPLSSPSEFEIKLKSQEIHLKHLQFKFGN